MILSSVGYASLSFNVAVRSALRWPTGWYEGLDGTIVPLGQESAHRVWGFQHDEKHLELCHGVDRVRDVCRKHD